MKIEQPMNDGFVYYSGGKLLQMDEEKPDDEEVLWSTHGEEMVIGDKNVPMQLIELIF